METVRSLLKITLAAALAGSVALAMTAQSSSNSRLEASPSSGTAPLTVTFTGSGSGQSEGVMRLEFGDGQSDESISTIRDFTRTHTYHSPGTYTAELKSGASRGQLPSELVAVARVTITVR